MIILNPLPYTLVLYLCKNKLFLPLCNLLSNAVSLLSILLLLFIDRKPLWYLLETLYSKSQIIAKLSHPEICVNFKNTVNLKLSGNFCRGTHQASCINHNKLLQPVDQEGILGKERVGDQEDWNHLHHLHPVQFSQCKFS